MALIEFKNLPDTSTPLNATNLNNDFKESLYKAGDTVKFGWGGSIGYGYVGDNGTSAYVFIPLSKSIDDIEHITISFNTDSTFSLMNHEKRFYYSLSDYSSYSIGKEYNGLKVLLNFKTGDTMTRRTPCVCWIGNLTITFS